MSLKPNKAGVYLLDALPSVDRCFDYFVPAEMREELTQGSFVLVPFGKGNRPMTGVVFHLSFEEEASALKSIKQIFDTEGLVLSEEMRALAVFMKEHTFCTVGDAVRAILPVGMFKGLGVYYTANDYPTETLNDNAKLLYAMIAGAKKGQEPGPREIQSQFSTQGETLLHSLIELGAVEKCYRSKDLAGRVYETFYAVSALAHSLPKGKKQLQIYEYLQGRGAVSVKELSAHFGACSAQLKSLVEKGQVVSHKQEYYRSVCEIPQKAPDENILTDEQQAAKDTICALCDSGEAKAALLYGVTGSGKTRVMKAVIDHVLSKGQGVIVLVPEISLTPQTVGLFTSFFGEQVAILHSGLSAGQRFDQWMRIKNGVAKICIGTRSAVFAPFENLGLIIIDEEQEHTYKSDMSPRYHARDIARFRCAKQNAVMLLSSATPSIESFYKAKEGIYTLCTLKERYAGAVLPKAIICDMRAEQTEERAPLGQLLCDELAQNLKNGEQSILFVNRRGYNHFASCALCGETVSCPHCSVSLTYHAYGRYRPEENTAAERAKHGYLTCHYCGYRQPVPTACPSCHSVMLQFMGCGTQMVENELASLFENTPILRLDSDTTGSKDAFDTKLDAFRKGEAQIMLGTQMVTKGHDFPDVTLVGVVLADSGLYLDDYRASEHTFSLITQVIGRAGRGKRPGRAVIQTFNPDHPAIVLAARQDYDTFYENEIKLRKALVFPPFCDILLLTLSSNEEGELQRAAMALDRKIRRYQAGEYKDLPLTLFGPFEAPLYRVKDTYRMRFVIKSKNCKALRAMIKQLMAEFSADYKQKVLLSGDLNPSSL